MNTEVSQTESRKLVRRIQELHKKLNEIEQEIEKLRFEKYSSNKVHDPIRSNN